MKKEWMKVLGLAILLGYILGGYCIAICKGAEQWTPSTDRRAGAILEGNWQSCLGGGGYDQANEYSEQVYTYRVNRTALFQLHLGPKDEFAVVAGDPEEHPEHDSEANLLRPAYKYGPWQGLVGGRTWHFAARGVHYRLNVVLAGGSRDTCESYFILLEKLL
jgi:hypothetical protein